MGSLDVKWPGLTVLCPLTVVFQMTANTLKAFPPVGFSKLEGEEPGEDRDVVCVWFVFQSQQGQGHDVKMCLNIDIITEI